MTEFKISGEGVKPACSEDFNLSNKFVNYLNTLRKTVKQFNCSTIQLVKAKAFTLAETLIVIGIIGVVAALTLPNLNHATGDKERVTRVKKIYSALTEAVDRAQVIYGDIDTWFNNDSSENDEKTERFAKRITVFMKVSKYSGFKDDAYEVVLSDGTSLNFYNTYLVSGIISDVYIDVDIDGPNKGKNQYGNDIFVFSINFRKSNELHPDYYIPDYSGILTVAPEMETSWIIQNGNADYLKATPTSDDGDGYYECPNGKILDWTTNTTCN